MAGQGSARVTLKEIDLSQVSNPQQQPQGVPAAVVGPSRKGPAFVPKTFANIQQFSDTFGDMLEVSKESNSNLFGPLALEQWMRNAGAGTFIRTLGVGDGSKNAVGAGFVVGDELVRKENDKVSQNKYADGSQLGRTMILGCFMEDESNSLYLQDAGLQENNASGSLSIDFGAQPNNSSTVTIPAISAAGDAKTFTFTFNTGANAHTFNDAAIEVGIDTAGDNAEEAAEQFARAINGKDFAGNDEVFGDPLENPKTYLKATLDGTRVTIEQQSSGAGSNTQLDFNITSSVTVSNGTDEKTEGKSTQTVKTTASGAQAASTTITVSGKPRVVQQAKTTITVNVDGNALPGDGQSFTVTDEDGNSQVFTFFDNPQAVQPDGLNGAIFINTNGKNNNALAEDIHDAIKNAVDSANQAPAGGVESDLNKLALFDPAGVADNFTITSNGNINLDIVTGLEGVDHVSEEQTQEGDDTADSFTVTDILGKVITFTFKEDADNILNNNNDTYDLNIQTQARKVFSLADDDDHTIAQRIHDAIVSAKANRGLLVTSTDNGDGTILIENDLEGADAELLTEVRDANNVLSSEHNAGTDGTPSQVTLILTGTPNVDDNFTLDTLDETDAVTNLHRIFKFVDNPLKDGSTNGEAHDVGDGRTFNVEISDNIDIQLSYIQNAIEKVQGAYYRVTINAELNSVTIINEKTEGFVQDRNFVFSLNDKVTVVGITTEEGKFGEQSINFLGGGGGSAPVLRGLLMLPQGIVASLDQQSTGANSDYNALSELSDGTATGEDVLRLINVDNKKFDDTTKDKSTLAGYQIGQVDNQGFKILLNGLKNTSEPAVLDCSFNPAVSTYFANVLNTDPTKIQEKGHYLYAYWDVEPGVAKPSNAGVSSKSGGSISNDPNKSKMIGFLTQSSGVRASEALNKPNYESFEARYQTAKTPWFVSQYFSKGSDSRTLSDGSPLTTATGEAKKLFRLHVLDDGHVGNDKLRVLISGIRSGRKGTYGSFDMALELFDGDSINGTIVAGWKNLNFDPESMNYIERVIGNQHVYYNFDDEENRQRLVSIGNFRVRNKYVRVEVSEDILNGSCPISALPAGFQGPSYLKTNLTNNFAELGDATGANKVLADGSLDNVQVPPLPYVKTISRKLKTNTEKYEVDPSLAWGIKFGSRFNGDKLFLENSELTHNKSIKSWTKYLPASAYESNSASTDSFQNNFFSLEKIAVKRNSDDSIDWDLSRYCRNGVRPSTHPTGLNSFVDFEKDANTSNLKFLKFRCLFQGGFDGLNIFDEDKYNQNNAAAYREANGENNDNSVTGPTIMAYRKALDVLTDKSAVELQLLAIPGIREPQVTNYAIKACEDRFDAMYIMDIQQKDEDGEEIKYDSIKPHVRKTIASFERRVLDTSFAAAYFPNVLVRRPSTGAPIEVPPSVCMLGVMSQNDSIADPWFAPAGLSRGRLNALNSNLQMNRDLLDELYDVDINPIYEPAGRSGEVYAFGQKTLLQEQSALDRINVRRLLINLRRKVKNVAQTLLFEPNRASTLQRFNDLVEPIMQNVQSRQGIERYKVQIDSSTTTQNDIENNTIRGKIYLQPTKSVEFISLDFVVTNSIN